ncbi:MAG: lamin tail domain-containing protein [Deltaproteobacteria bacterium]|nr:lamin tail domain-containing protein [Deltaproteobacteria bacterium]
MKHVVTLAVMTLAACGDDGSTTPCGTLLPGDLVVTEVFSDPSGADDGREWFEIYNASDHAAALEGLTITHSRGDGQMRRATTLEEVTLAPGEYLVLGNVAAELRPTWVDVGYGAKLGDFYNSGAGRLALACGGTEIDAATYGNVRAGLSRQLDGGHTPDYTVNDDQAQWCSASKVMANEFSPGNYGTPGAANEDCEIIVPGMCDDGESLRPVMAPGPGDLVITEVMPNPSAVADAMGEWFEVQAMRDIDLNGLSVDRVGDSTAAETIDSRPHRRRGHDRLPRVQLQRR